MEENTFIEITKTPEELILDEIRNSSDYKEVKTYLDESQYSLINTIEESSIILNKLAITRYLYNDIFGGCGSTLIIINL
jgi:hypothetical protein